LNPSSPNYIARRIGDRYQTINNSNELVVSGDYPNLSKFIRVECDPGVSNKTYVATLIPMGYRALNSPIPTLSGNFILPTASNITFTNSETTYYGFDFTSNNNLNYLAPIPSSGSNTGSNADFYLGNVSQSAAIAFPTAIAPYTGSIQSVLDAGTISSNVKLSVRKFIVPFQGGFDGVKPNVKKYAGQYITATNTFGFDCSTSTSTGTTAYNKAFTLLSNTDYYDMNLLLTPGLVDSLHSSVTSAARTLVTNRKDTFYVMY
jgi:hypothetical protein